MSFFSFFSKVSGWYRVLIVTSITWVVIILINTDPWTSRGIRGGTYNHWDDFLLFGILPVAILWGIIWVIHGVINNQHLKRKDIDLIKGFDRIAMVIAIIAIIPSFIIGMDITKDKFRILLPEYKAWEIKFENRKKWLIENSKLEHNDFKSERNDWLANYIEGFNVGDKQYQTIKAMEPRNKYKYPSNFEGIMVSIVFALLSFAIMLFGIRGLTRAIKLLYLWILEGFEEK